MAITTATELARRAQMTERERQLARQLAESERQRVALLEAERNRRLAEHEQNLAEQRAEYERQMTEQLAEQQRRMDKMIDMLKAQIIQRQQPRRQNELTRLLKEEMHPANWEKIADVANPLPKGVNPKVGLHAMSQILAGMIEMHNKRVSEMQFDIGL